MVHTACRLTLLLTLLSLQSSPANAVCPADGCTWKVFGQNCYCFVHEPKDVFKMYTIQEAKQKCNDFSLLTVPNVEVNEFIVNYSHKVWKGTVNVWLGMYYDTDDEAFKWNDESPVNFTNWVETVTAEWDEPLMDTCVVLVTSSGKWENVSCSSETAENAVVCETSQKAGQNGIKNGSPLLSALVILSVVAILGVSAVIWFLQQRHNSGSSMFPSFEYHPPFRSPSADETCLVEAEELEETS